MLRPKRFIGLIRRGGRPLTQVILTKSVTEPQRFGLQLITAAFRWLAPAVHQAVRTSTNEAGPVPARVDRTGASAGIDGIDGHHPPAWRRLAGQIKKSARHI